MSQEHEETPFKALIRKWEGAKDSTALRNVAFRTATMLARVQDVPRDVLNALDEIVEDEGGFFCSWRSNAKRAAAIYAVVRYLHTLSELERLIPAKKKSLPE